MPRMALCGGLRIGVDSSEPKTPPLVIVNVPPCRSATVILPSRAFCGQLGDALLDAGEAQLVGVAQHRHHQPLLGADGHADVVVVVINDVGAVDAGVDQRGTPSAPRRTP